MSSILNLCAVIGPTQITWPDFPNTESYQHWPSEGTQTNWWEFYISFSNDGRLINLWNAGFVSRWSCEGRRLRGSESLRSTVEGLGKYGGGAETIEHPSLSWGKSLEAVTKTSAPWKTHPDLLLCCSWLTLTHVRVVMWYHGNPTDSPNPKSSHS